MTAKEKKETEKEVIKILLQQVKDRSYIAGDLIVGHIRKSIETVE